MKLRRYLAETFRSLAARDDRSLYDPRVWFHVLRVGLAGDSGAFSFPYHDMAWVRSGPSGYTDFSVRKRVADFLSFKRRDELLPRLRAIRLLPDDEFPGVIWRSDYDSRASRLPKEATRVRNVLLKRGIDLPLTPSGLLDVKRSEL